MLPFFSCEDDDDIKDPADTITLNMLNEQNGKTFSGKSDAYINKANNFFTTLNFITDAGKAKGVGVEIQPLLNKLTKEVATTPGNVYQIFDARTIQDFPSRSKAVQIEAGYYQVYVVSPITNNNSTTGAIIKYITTYPDKQGLPQLEKVVGNLNDKWTTIAIKY